MAHHRGPLVALALSVVAVLGALSAAPATAASPRTTGALRLNDVQVVGTHNSYHRELSPPEEAAYDELVRVPGDYEQYLAYTHAPLPEQLEEQGVRGLELDLFPDPEGGLYSEPLVRQRLGLGPLPDPAWAEPGIKVFHIADLDYETTCVQLTTCLRQVQEWSDGNPEHVPVMIMLELKGSEDRAEQQGGVVSPPWDAAALDALDAEIRSVFDDDDLVTPDDVRRPGLTLEESVRDHGWPLLDDARGQVMFLLDNGGSLNETYAAEAPSLEGRVLFTNSVPGRPDAAFLKRNEPRGGGAAQIQELVRDGYLVRTRSDLPLETVRSGDTAMLDAAVVSGAHLISTDFPAPGMSDRYGSDFVARLPNGGTVWCNPVTSPRGCRDRGLDPAFRPSPRGSLPARVEFGADPVQPVVVPSGSMESPCDGTLVEVVLRNPGRRGGHARASISVDGPLTASRTEVATYLPAGYELTLPLRVFAPPGTEPGEYDLQIRSTGRFTGRGLTIPVRVAGPDETDGNVALAQEVVASSTVDPAVYPPCTVVDGNRDSADWRSGNGWNDGTAREWPDTLEVRFGGVREIDRVDLYTLDSALYPAARWGLRDWEVEAMVDGAWLTVAEVRGNAAGVVRSTFDPVDATALRIVALGSNSGDYARIVEIEAFGPGAGSPG